MPDSGFPFLRSNSSGIAQINFMVQSLIRNIQSVSLTFHKLMYHRYCDKLVIIRTDMHTLYAQTLIVGQKLYFGEIIFLFLRKSPILRTLFSFAACGILYLQQNGTLGNI